MGSLHDEAAARHSLGLDYSARGELDKAQEAFKHALRLWPDHVDTLYDLARLYARRAEWAKAVETFHRLLELTPDFAQAYSELGLARVGQGRPKKAIEAFESALRWKPDDAFAMTNLAVSLQEVRQSRKARELFEQVIRIAPGMEEAYQGLTRILVSAGKLAEAEAVLLAGEKAVTEAEKRARLQRSIGFLRAEQGRLTDAIQWFQTSLHTDPSSGDAHIALADALTELQRYVEAFETLQTALERHSARAGVHARLGSVLEKLGRYPEALTAFQEAVSLDPQCLTTNGPDWSASYERAQTACAKRG